jgi:hypothetical protein
MPRRVEVKEGQTFRDGTGLTVRLGEIDGHDRVHFSVTGAREASCAWTRRNALFRLRQPLYQD